jgi:diketogulonate reductase-like aldo/keto reductase
MHQHNVVPFPGTTKESHLLSNIAAMKVMITPEELQLLNHLEKPKGNRYTETSMKAYGFDE